MLRRGNKSKKVPNVKLRPAAPRNSRDARTPESTEMHYSSFDSEQETSFADLCPRPFKDVVLCATGIDDKMALFKLALELGAQSVNDLTDRVTHVIAKEPGSAKYKCALENRIPIMHPSWIIESHKTWLKGDDVDKEESIERHRLPVFSGVVLTVSGIEDVERRIEINRKLTREGGTYTKNLERPVRVTHLLCASTMGEVSEKMKYAEKFNQKGEANIHIIWEDWFWDSLRFGGRFNEEAYKVSNPPPPPKLLPEGKPINSIFTHGYSYFIAPTSPPRSSSVPVEAERPSSPNVHEHEEEEEIASVKRVPAVTLQIWESILKPRGFEVQEGRLVRSPSKSQAPHASNVSPTRPASPTRTLSKGIPASALSSFRRAQSFASAPKDISTQRQPFQRTPTISGSSAFLARPVGSAPVPDGNDIDVPIASTSAISAAVPEPAIATAPKLFAGLKFRVLGEARAEATWFLKTKRIEIVDFVIVRLVSGSSFFRAEGDDHERGKYRTECWLERCLFAERICALDEHVAFAPLMIEIPIVGAEGINVSYSGLDQSEACWVRRLLRALGINLAPNFSRRSTHLLCPSGTGAKADKAREWNIPLVDMTWLAAIANTGAVPAVLDINQHDAAQDAGAPVDVVMEDFAVKSDKKGKGKEKAANATMENIINAEEMHTPLDRSQLSYVDQAEVAAAQEEEQDEDVMFGQPSALLGGPVDRPPPATPPPLSRTTTLEHISDPCTRASSDDPDAGMDQEMTLSQIELDKATTQIPSSASPSPMKLPGEQGSASTSPPSRGKLSRAASKVLQESITSLLGKRPSVEDDAAKAHGPRSGKRARPPSRTTLQFREETASVESDPTTVTNQLENSAFNPYPAGEEDTSFLGTDAVQVVGENARVTYADPGQRNEKKRLLKLLTEEKREIWELEPNSDIVLPQLAGLSTKNGREGRGESVHISN
ncbi:hypothetical protein A0H81_07422 [Grifola frondosa]|uniref:BRCT domain-containing protein n=1 Tax=Grifola frondosa TaxID=5627 RepID=A0A1C7M6W0_GRIFR|nr:hypothetical protein A0H81_07422 [Grifola frondosa]